LTPPSRKREETKEEVLEQLLKAYRSTQVHGWESDQDLFERVATGAREVVKAYLDVGGANNIHAARLLLKNTVKKTEQTFEEHPLRQELQLLLLKVEKLDS